MTFKHKFGATVKEARTALNLTAPQLATMIGVTPAQVYNIEAGKSFPGDVDSLLNALNIECKFTPPGKIVKIYITALEWFDKTYGNSYFAARVYIYKHKMETETIYLPFQYGYGDHYEHQSAEAIFKAGYFAEYNDGRTALFHICRECGIELSRFKYEDQKKADVVRFGKPD